MQTSNRLRPTPFYRNKSYLLASLLALASLALLVWMDIAYIMPIKRLDVPNLDNDLGVFWSGSRVVWQGGNPYDYSPGSLIHRIANAAGGDLDVFVSPFFLTMFFMPLAALPLKVAAIILLVFNQLVLGGAVYLVVRLAGQRFSAPILLQTLVLVVLWRYSFEVMILNNLSIIMLGATVLSYYLSRNGRPFAAGLAATLLMLKPQLCFLIVPLLLVVPTETGGWLNRATYRRWLGFAVGGLVFAVYSFLVFPSWLWEWLHSLTSRLAPTLDSEMTSVRSVAVLLADGPLVTPVYLLMAGIICLSAVAVWWRNRNNARDFTFVLAVVVCLNMLAAPHIRSYDFCLLLLPLLFCFFKLRQTERAADKQGQRRFHYSLLWYALLILPWPLHQLTITSTFAWENLVTLALLAATIFTWRVSARNSGKEIVSG